jgi:hypothetical protein
MQLMECVYRLLDFVPINIKFSAQQGQLLHDLSGGAKEHCMIYWDGLRDVLHQKHSSGKGEELSCLG